jgi:hypothetical protein
MSSRRALPRWACVKKRESPRDFQTRTGYPYVVSVPSEELYLRTRCCVATLQSVDRAVLKIFDEGMGPLVKDLQQFFKSSSPWEQRKSATARKRPRFDTSSDESDNADDDAMLERLFTFEAPKHYSSTLLPVAVLHGPLCSLDRHEFMRYLHENLGKSRSAAVCWLRHASQQNSVGSLLREVLRQCLDQHESDVEKSAKILKDIDRNRSSVAESLLQWAESVEETSSPDSIVVLLENIDSSCILFQDFLKRLSTLRSQQGLLICVVLCSSPTRASIPLQSSTQGLAGIHVQERSFPESHKLYEKIWNQILLFEPLPVSLPAGILRSIRESFTFQHGSLIQSVLSLKQALAQRFVRPGSFLMLDSTTFLSDQERRRIRWFCLDEEARSYAFPDHAPSSQPLEQQRKRKEKERRAYEVLLRVLREIMSEGEVHQNSSLAVVEMLEHSFSDSAYVKLRKELIRLFHKDSQENLLRLLRYREAFLWEQMSRGVNRLPPQLGDLSIRLHELIVLVDCNSHDTGERASSARTKQLVAMMEEWIYDVCRDTGRLLASGLDGMPPADSTSIPPEPRRALAGALLAHSEPSSRDERDITSLPCELFALIRDCVVVSREEWFRRFWLRSTGDEVTPQELWPKFAFGVYQLEFLGLVQEKSGSTRSERVYEKTALVWCSGE